MALYEPYGRQMQEAEGKLVLFVLSSSAPARLPRLGIRPITITLGTKKKGYAQYYFVHQCDSFRESDSGRRVGVISALARGYYTSGDYGVYVSPEIFPENVLTVSKSSFTLT